jgi:hypothetical protein
LPPPNRWTTSIWNIGVVGGYQWRVMAGNPFDQLIDPGQYDTFERTGVSHMARLTTELTLLLINFSGGHGALELISRQRQVDARKDYNQRASKLTSLSI